MGRGVHQIVEIGERAPVIDIMGMATRGCDGRGPMLALERPGITDFEAEMRASGFWLDEHGQPKASLFCESPGPGIAI